MTKPDPDHALKLAREQYQQNLRRRRRLDKERDAWQPANNPPQTAADFDALDAENAIFGARRQALDEDRAAIRRRLVAALRQVED